MASIIGDTIGTAVSSVIGKFFDTFLVFLTKGGERECPANMERMVDGKRVYCRAKWNLQDDTWLKSMSDKSDEGFIYFKPSFEAINRQIADATNCPPGTFPFNGSCWSSCPPNFERQEAPLTDAEKADAQKSGNPAKPRYRCVAQCEKDWHVYDWTHTGNARFDQGTTQLPQYCYHLPPNADYGETEDDIKNNMPYTLRYITTELEDHPGARTPTLNEKGEISSKEDHFPARGIYAERVHFMMPPAVDPLPCTEPNKVTASGKCVQACPSGYDLVGELCFKTKAACPADWNDDPVSRAFCRPQTLPMPRYWSIIQIILILASIAAVAAVVGKAVTRPSVARSAL